MNTNTDPLLQEQKVRAIFGCGIDYLLYLIKMSTLQERTDTTMTASAISGSTNAYISNMDPKYARKYTHLHTFFVNKAN